MVLRIAFAGLAITVAAMGQEMSARQLFYAAPTPAPTQPTTQPGSAGTAPKKTPPPPPVTPPKQPDPPVVKYNPQGNTTPKSHIMRVSETRRALGLRYSILKQSDHGESEVDVKSVFRSGDKIRLNVEVNDEGFLYIVARGSSGTWKPLFPAHGWDNNLTRVQAQKKYDVPPGMVFTFDQQKGSERMMVVLSRTPAKSFEDLVESLQRQAEAKPEGDGEVVASNRLIDDAMVAKLEKLYARDLVVEKADAPADQPQEHAVYVVNASGTQDARVVADVLLVHQ